MSILFDEEYGIMNDGLEYILEEFHSQSSSSQKSHVHIIYEHILKWMFCVPSFRNNSWATSIFRASLELDYCRVFKIKELSKDELRAILQQERSNLIRNSKNDYLDFSDKLVPKDIPDLYHMDLLYDGEKLLKFLLINSNEPYEGSDILINQYTNFNNKRIKENETYIKNNKLSPLLIGDTIEDYADIFR